MVTLCANAQIHSDHRFFRLRWALPNQANMAMTRPAAPAMANRAMAGEPDELADSRPDEREDLLGGSAGRLGAPKGGDDGLLEGVPVPSNAVRQGSVPGWGTSGRATGASVFWEDLAFALALSCSGSGRLRAGMAATAFPLFPVGSLAAWLRLANSLRSGSSGFRWTVSILSDGEKWTQLSRPQNVISWMEGTGGPRDPSQVSRGR